jgi:hypothetical protein
VLDRLKKTAPLPLSHLGAATQTSPPAQVKKSKRRA